MDTLPPLDLSPGTQYETYEYVPPAPRRCTAFRAPSFWIAAISAVIYILVFIILMATSSGASATSRRLTIFAGQSNVGAVDVTTTDVPQGSTIPRTFIWDPVNNNIQNLEHGVNTNPPPAGSTGLGIVGPEWGFSKMFRHYHDPAVIDHFVMKHNRGGSSVLQVSPAEWDSENPASVYYTSFIAELEQIAAARPYLLRRAYCMIWWQGEADVNASITALANYPRKFLKMINEVRTIMDSSRMIVAWPLLSYRRPVPDTRTPEQIVAHNAQTDRFREMQREVVALDPYVRLFYSDDLSKRDAVHFDWAGISEGARRAYQECYRP